VNWIVGQFIQLAGAALILVAFVGAQTGRLEQKSRLYLLANALGSTALAMEAAYYGQWGFLLLEGAWAIISVMGIVSAALPAGKDPDWSGSAGGHAPGGGIPAEHLWPAGMREGTGDLPGSQTTDAGDRSQIAEEPLPAVQLRIEAGDRDAVVS
jgi:hypothetical protein